MSQAASRKRKKKSAGALRRWWDRQDDTPAGRALFRVAWLLTGVALLGALEPYVWVGALVHELGFQLALLAGLSAAVAAARRAWVALASLLSLALVFAFPLLPLYRTARPTPQSGPLLQVATAHLAGVELDERALRGWLERARPDALALTGLRRPSRYERLPGYRTLRGQADVRALLLVREALLVPSLERTPEHATAVLRVGRCQMRVLALELPALAAYPGLAARELSIARLARLPRASRSVWLGQLGSRPEAHDLRALLAAHELRDGRVGHGRLATAPGTFGSLGFPLSGVLVHGWIGVRDLRVEAPLAAGAQRLVRGTLELTEPRCKLVFEMQPK